MKRLLLTVISTSSLLLLLVFGHYRKWFLDKPLDYWNAFCYEVRHPASLEEIRRLRYGKTYMLSMKIQALVKASGSHDPILLFEPNSFYHDSLHTDLHMPEPAVFYYYTGLRGAWMSDTLQKADYLVVIRNGNVTLQPIETGQQLRAILTRYRSFTPAL